ncbi:hypothetical protein AAFC00_005834 [Neodothiora populina]|uniref:UBX domain-containing protein n=1 Tax=Neodothiora populina TaxID=2781224 RepID=A0ABR3P606_9PEZI
MFYQGDLQSGIALAIQEQKLVACLVRKDDDPTSETWENEWLKSTVEDSETSLGDRLAEKAVFLRLDHGTQEAGFLSAFCSLESTPKLIIIKQGIVLEDIDLSVSEEVFKSRLLAQCKNPTKQASHITSANDTAPTDVSQVLPAAVTQAIEPSDTTAPAPPLATVQDAAGTTAQPQEATLQEILSERNARMDEDHQQKRAAEKEAKKAAVVRSKEMADKQAAESSSVPAARQDWLNQQRLRQQEARAERERILKTIQQDKITRQERERQRKIAAQGSSSSAVPEASSSVAPHRSDHPRGWASTTCNLQIRLFDGTSLRSRFDSSATLDGAVRTFVDAQSESEVPYNFREIRTPQPSRTIEIGEEGQTLQSLGLTPSATLVLVPVHGYTDAYASRGAAGLMYRGVHSGFSLVSGALGGALGLVGGMLGYGGDAVRDGPYLSGVADESEEASDAEGTKIAGAGPSSGFKVRTLADQREDNDEQELYNGNQLNFEPRKKADDADEDKP